MWRKMETNLFFRGKWTMEENGILFLEENGYGPLKLKTRVIIEIEKIKKLKICY